MYKRPVILLLRIHLLLLPIALGLLILSMAVPWLTVNLFGLRSYSATDILGILTTSLTRQERDSEKSQNDPVISDLTSSIYPNSSFSFVTGVSLHVISVLVMTAAVTSSIIFRNKATTSWPSRIGVVAGISAVVAAASWFYSIQSFKVQFIEDAELSGGIIGEEWKGKAETILNSLIVIGFGPYLVAAAGIIGISAHLVGGELILHNKSRILPSHMAIDFHS